jgi:transposase
VHDGSGILLAGWLAGWLAARRLHQGKFISPLAGGSNLALQRQQLDALAMGLPWQRLADCGFTNVV